MSTCRQDRKQPRGKNADKNFVSITARIPKTLKFRLKQAQNLHNIDTNTLLERLLSMWLLGLVDTTQEEAAHDPIDASQQEAAHWLDVLKDPIDASKEEVYKEAQARLLATARASLGLNQRDMASFLGIAQKTVSNYERGVRVAPKNVLDRCVTVLQEAAHDPIDASQQEAQGRLL